MARGAVGAGRARAGPGGAVCVNAAIRTGAGAARRLGICYSIPLSPVEPGTHLEVDGAQDKDCLKADGADPESPRDNERVAYVEGSLRDLRAWGRVGSDRVLIRIIDSVTS